MMQPARRPRALALALAALVALGAPALPATAAEDATGAVDDLLVNGGFEDVTGLVFNSGGYATVVAGGALPGWTVAAGSVEVDRSLALGGPWEPATGSHSLDLNGDEPGAVRQVVATAAGERYRLSFAGAVHPTCGPDRADVVVRWADATAATVTFTNTRSTTDPGWSEREVEVVGTGSEVTLELATGVPTGSCGPLLDDVSLRPVAPAAPTELRDVALDVAAATTAPGAEQVPVGDVPLDQVPPDVLARLAAAPLRSVPLRSVPLRSVPLRSVPLRSVPLRSVPLRSVTLNQVPLVGGLTWADVLAGTELADLPTQNVTLDDVLALPAGSDGRLDEVDLDSVDLSGSPLRNISLASLYLGASEIDDLPLDPASPGGAYADWCAAVASLGDATCAELGITPESPVLALDLAAVPLRSVPLRSVPLRSVPVVAPLRSVPLRSVPLRSVPLGTIPLRSVDGLDVAAVEGLAGLRLSELSPQSTVRAELLLLDPTLAERTLGDLAAAGLLDGFTLADLGPFEGPLAGLTIGSIADHVDVSVTLGTALLSLLDAAEVPWEALPLAALDLPRYDSDGPLVRYTVSFALAGDGATRSAGAVVTLPEGFAYAGNVTGLPAGAGVPRQQGRTLTWDLAGLDPTGTTGTVSFAFDVRPPLALQQGTASLEVLVPGVAEEPALSGSDTAAVQVVARTGTDPATAPVVAPDTLVVGHTPAPGQVGYVRVAVPAAGTRVSVFLGQHVIDNDVVVYAPEGGGTAPGAAPLRSVPLRSVPLADPGADATGATRVPGTLQDDVPLLPGRRVVGFSAQRGTAVEQVDLLSDGGGGAYAVQVSGYNGAWSEQPWVLRVRQVTPAETVCPSRGYPAQSGGGDGLPAGPGAGTRALFLVNEQQLVAEYGPDRTAALLAGLERLADRADVAGAVVRVDDSAAVTRAYDAWNADPCSVGAANRVVAAVSGLVLGYARTLPQLDSVTVVGGDQQVPHGRVPDLTVAVNERGFAPEVTGVDADGGRVDNPMSAAAAAGYVLSDDPYGTLEALAWLDRELYVPELALGRLVETPEQVLGQLAQFTAAGGVVDPGSAVTTGYDFLVDGAEAVDDALGRSLAAAGGSAPTRTTLVDDSWTRADLARVLGIGAGAPPPPAVASVNAHFDPRRALPAAGDTAGDESDLFVTEDVVGSDVLRSSLLFSMGCHAGLSVPAGYSGIAGAPPTADWPKAFAEEGALWVANTGYGLGDTAVVALSEELMAGFAARLDGTTTAGAALSWAKQDYVGSLGAYGSADEKVLQQVVFYGLPMWRVGGPTSDGSTPVDLPPAPPVQTVTPTPLGGSSTLGTVVTTLTPTLTRRDLPGLGSLWTVDGETQATAGQPVQPRTSRPATAADGTEAHGVLVTGLTSRDVAGVDPVFARAVLDDSTNEPEQSFTGVAFPAGIASLATSETPTGRQTRLVVVPGQFFSDPGRVDGTQRLFDEVTTTTYYSGSTRHVPPSFRTMESQRGDGAVTFTVDVTAAAGEDVERVLVLVRDGGAARWRPVELVAGTGSTWTGTAPVASRSIEWFAQAVSSAGNVAVSANKGVLFGSAATFSVDLVGTEGLGGWFTSDVTVVVDGPAARYTASIDGGVPQPVLGSLTLTDDGTYDVRIAGSDGEVRDLVVRIDRTAPAVTVVPADGSAAFVVGGPGAGELRCDDGPDGSGLAAPCPTTPVSVDTSRPGSITGALADLGTGPVADLAGNATPTYAYAVRYAFSGFLPPVDGAGVNVVTAGSTVPVRFRLAAADGPVGQVGAVRSVSSRVVPCAGGAPDGSAGVVVEPPSSVRVQGEQVLLTWRTRGEWAGSCRLLEVALADGTTPTAVFRFR